VINAVWISISDPVKLFSKSGPNRIRFWCSESGWIAILRPDDVQHCFPLDHIDGSEIFSNSASYLVENWIRIRTGSDCIRTEDNFGRIRTEKILIILKISKILVVIRFNRFAKWVYILPSNAKTLLDYFAIRTVFTFLYI